MNNFKRIALALTVALIAMGLSLTASASENTLYYNSKCPECHEIIYTVPAIDLHNEESSGLPYTDGKVSFQGGGSGTTYGYFFPDNIVGTDKAPYDFEFTLTFDYGVGKAEHMSGVYNNGNGKHLLKYASASCSILRQYPVSDGNGGWLTDQVDIGSMIGFGVEPIPLVRMKTGDSVKFTFSVIPESNSVDIYVNGEYKATRSISDKAFSADDLYMVFGDSSMRTTKIMRYTVSDFKIVTADVTRKNETVYTGNAVKSVFFTNNTVGLSTECVCGQLVSYNDTFEQTLITDNVYYGNVTIENLPTDGEYWIATDYNIRTAKALEEIKATDADIVFGDLRIAVDRATINAPETYQIALKISYPENSATADVELWIDGELVKTYKDVALSDSLTLGSVETTDVRFNYTKVIELGDNKDEIEYNDSADGSLKPCYHTVYGDVIENPVRDEDGNVTFNSKCKSCGEIVYGISAIDHHNEATSKLTYTDGKLILKNADVRYVLPSALIGEDKDPYQIKFKFTLDEVADPSSLENKTNGRNILQYGGSLNSILRIYPVSDGKGGYRDDLFDIGSLVAFNGRSEKLMQMGIGDTIDVSIIVTPSDKSADIYINGDFVLRREGVTDAVLPNAEKLAPGDKRYNSTFSDIYLLQVDNPHIHDNKWDTNATEKITVTNDGFEYISEYECYCGEAITSGKFGKNITVADNVYYGNGIIENLPTEGEFWFATDYNIRTAEALEAIKATEADIVFGNLKITVDRATINSPETYQIALKISYPENSDKADVQLWINGELVKTYEDVVLSDSITLGSLETADIRFNYTKVIELSDSKEEIEYNDSTDGSLKPCYHTVYSDVIGNPVRDENGNVTFNSKCKSCGEIVYGISAIDHHNEATSKLTYTDGKLILKNADVRYVLPSALRGEDKNAYQIKFKFTLDEVANPSSLENNTNGRNILQYGGSLNSILRIYPVSDGNGGYRDDLFDIGSLVAFNGRSEKLMQMGIGDTIDVSIIVTPADKTADIYINGELVLRREGSTDAVLPTAEKLAPGDKNYSSTFSEIFILQIKDPHTHSDKWLSAAEKSETTIVIGEDNTVTYEYDCYCGERASKGIAEVIASDVAPQYGLTDNFVAVTAPDFEGEAVFAGFVMAKTLPAEGTKALVSVGEKAVLSVDNTGLLYVNGNATETILTVGEYLDFAVMLSEYGYSVYFDGEYIGDGELEALGDISVGSEEMGKFHFESMALVTLSADGECKYSVVTDSHNHSFDPYTAELIFNAEKTTINVEYVCTVCDKYAVDGITNDLYDDTETDEIEAIPAIIGTPVGGSTVVNTVGKYTADSDTYWFSADFKVKEFSNKNRQPIVSFGENGIVLIDADGTLRLGNKTNTVIGSVKKQGSFNITFSVQKGAPALVHVYLDGKYCGTLEQTLDGTESIKVGTGSTGSLEVTNVKLCEIGNGGVRAIGSFSCQFHTYNASNAIINYLDLDTFVVKNRCLVCGHTVIERPAYNNYVGATMPIYDAHGNIELPLNEADFGIELDASYHGHWIVVDVNQQSGWYDIGNFHGFKNLIGSKGNSLVLVDPSGKLMLGNGKELDYKFRLGGKNTMNFALEYVFADKDNDTATDDGRINLYIDGKYVSTFDIAEVKYKYEHTSESYEEFGSIELENIKFYNIRSFVPCSDGEFISFTYEEDESVIPCAHVFDGYSMTKTAVFGEKIQIVYICNKCGERVHKVFDKNLYDTSLNSKFVFDENGELTISNTTDLVSSPDIIGTEGAKYWLKFKLDVKELNVDLVSANDNNDGKGRILLNFNTNNNSPLRLFGVYDYKTRQYRSDCLSVRNNAKSSASEIVRIYEGKTYEFALFVDPEERSAEIYLDGKYVTTRYNATYANGKNIRFLDGNWGTFTISDFAFVTGNNIDHIHTAEYSEALGMTPVVEYGDRTLVHKFICTCGKTIEAGIDEVMGYEIQNMENVTSATAIAEASNGSVNRTPYWVSAKVYGDGSKATVYSYNGTELVGIENGYYTVGGVATNVPVLNTTVPGGYDLISLNVMPTYDKAIVYINGFERGIVNVEFADSEKFNILLGGGAELDFRFIKAATLKDGANNTVVVATCGNHKFEYRQGIIPNITEDGIDYICRYCDKIIKTVKLGDGGIISHKDKITSKNKSVDLIADLDFYNKILMPEDGGNNFMIFKIKATDLSSLADADTGVTLLKFQTNSGYPIYIRLFKIDDNTAKITGWSNENKSVEFMGCPVIEKDKIYTFIIETSPSTGEYYVHMDGVYIGCGSLSNINQGENSIYKLILGGGNAGGWEISEFRIFNPTIEEIKTDDSEDEETIYPHSHFPDVTKKESISVENGVIAHKFTCVCGKKIELNKMNPVVSNDKDVDFSRVTANSKYVVNEAVNYGTETYVLSFDFKVHSLNISAVGDDGAIVGSLFQAKTSRSLLLLCVYPHLIVDGETYTDKDEDGYADDVMDIRSKLGIDSGNPILATVRVGDTINFTYVINPTSRNLAVYINGEYRHLRQNFSLLTSGNVYLGFNASYGIFGYDNFRIVRLSDECEHVAPSCSQGVYKVKCELCQKTVEPTHNYKTEYDRRHLWTKYTCETCGAFHIEFNSLSRLKDVKFINESKLMEYLCTEYCPVFNPTE